MLDIGTVKTSVYARWPKELNFDEVLERLIDESPKLLQGVAVHWETTWDSHEDEKLRYDVGRPSMSELREKYLPIYNEIANN